MKILRKKLKKVSKPKKIFYFLTIFLFLITFFYFIYGLLRLTAVETLIRVIIIIFFSTWFILYLLIGLISILSKKNKTFIFITLISLICCPIFVVTSFCIQKGINLFSQTNRAEIKYVSNLIALKETKFDEKSTIGMIETESDIEGNVLAKKMVADKNLKNKIVTYEDYTKMITDLYKGKIDACFVSSNYSVIFQNETFGEENNDGTVTSLADRVKVLYEYSEEMANQDLNTLEASKTKVLTEPFTVLVMGVDSTTDGLKANQAFNGDTLIMITFNPNTLTATMFSIPRDLYVPIACNNDRYAKINSSAAYGSSCVISTVQKLTGINIDFYVKVNFKGVVDLVNVLGGVTVDVEKPDFTYNQGINCGGRFCEQNSDRAFGKYTIFLDPGIQTLNGEEALAYARCRHLYKMSDIARNQHQQDIIEAMAQKLKEVNSLQDFENILQTISKNIETNLTTDQILSFYNVGKSILMNNQTEALSIKRTYLNFYNLTVWRGYNASALGYYDESLKAITDLMKVNLELQKNKDIKTFNISYNEEYETPLVGKNLYGGSVLETLKNYIGFDKTYVKNWCDEKNINCTFTEKDSNEEKGSIIEQSVHENELLINVSEIEFTYSNGKLNNDNNSDSPNNNDKNDSNKDNQDKNNDDKKDEIKDPDDIIIPKPDDEESDKKENDDKKDDDNQTPEENTEN